MSGKEITCRCSASYIFVGEYHVAAAYFSYAQFCQSLCRLHLTLLLDVKKIISSTSKRMQKTIRAAG
ncbi:unnamed protein product [Acanthoscelides obtectus]|uniref:Uncharacterized protein n=1 Tax=Acanthoscelides obtectus TaxID=200917 RepID=A0A9P0MEK3_ACAOB|nr:unnamed protein product [Acanthoscelides obtectus]CAK1640877.1 hypothetical protein AOBTE_LOCUS11991 [Acanthoscelides obtectus]